MMGPMWGNSADWGREAGSLSAICLTDSPLPPKLEFLRGTVVQWAPCPNSATNFTSLRWREIGVLDVELAFEVSDHLQGS